MKYIYHGESIPQEARQELNDKILYLIDQDLAEPSGITREDIYNCYSGDGGLHGLKRSDFANYSGSIESNQMQMVLAKEKLNLYMKGKDVDLDEIYDRFGVDYDLMSLLMSREKDEDGHFAISWGEQKIS